MQQNRYKSAINILQQEYHSGYRLRTTESYKKAANIITGILEYEFINFHTKHIIISEKKYATHRTKVRAQYRVSVCKQKVTTAP